MHICTPTSPQKVSIHTSRKSGIYTYYHLIGLFSAHISKKYVPNRMPTQHQKQIDVKKRQKQTTKPDPLFTEVLSAIFFSST